MLMAINKFKKKDDDKSGVDVNIKQANKQTNFHSSQDTDI